MNTDGLHGGTGKRVALVYAHGNLDSIPSLCGACCLLAEKGYLVDIFTLSRQHYVPPVFSAERIAVLPLQAPPVKMRRGAWRLIPDAFYLPLLVRARHRRMPYACVIGVDPEGLIEAAAMAQWVRVPFAYYSLELMFEKELASDSARELKRRERELNRQAAFTVIQDPERGEALARENGIPMDRLVFVPNAPLGKACRVRSSYLRDKYRLAPDTKIVLNSGSLDTWAGAHELIWSTREWPANWTLVCHTRYRQSYLDGEYFKALKCMGRSGRVIFSTDPVDRETYPEIVRSADVGVAFYVPQDNGPSVGDNLRLIGLSSGKMAYCLQAGIPVLVNEVASLRRLVQTYRCGEVVSDPGSTVGALGVLFRQYEDRSHGALRCFEAEWGLAPAFEKVFQAIRDLPRGAANLREGRC